MRIPTLASALLALLFASTVTQAQTHYSLEIARKVVGLASPRVAPDGQHIAFLVSRPNFDQNVLSPSPGVAGGDRIPDAGIVSGVYGGEKFTTNSGR